MKKALGPVIAALLAGATAYFYDSRSGKRRRSVAQGKLRHAVKLGREGLSKGLIDLESHARGVVHDLTVRFETDDAIDPVILERVRATLGRHTRDAHRITVSVENGRVVLDGPCCESDLEQLLGAVRRVRGVRVIESHLEGYSSITTEPRREHRWRPGVRLLATAGGAGVALAGAIAGQPLLVLVGGAALVRAVTNLDAKHLLGVGVGSHDIEVQKTMRITAPVEDLYALWSTPSKFPLFMSHVEEVKRNEDGSWRWRVKGPMGRIIEWDAVVTEALPKERISWSSKPGSVVETSGTVRFERRDLTSTVVHVDLFYNPLGGAIGHAIAKLFGADPQKQIDDDMLRLKSLLERGKATGHETVSREDVVH